MGLVIFGTWRGLYFVMLLKNVEYIFDWHEYNCLKECVDVLLNSQYFFLENNFILFIIALYIPGCIREQMSCN